MEWQKTDPWRKSSNQIVIAYANIAYSKVPSHCRQQRTFTCYLNLELLSGADRAEV